MIDLNRKPVVTIHQAEFRGAVGHGARVVMSNPSKYPEPNQVYLIYIKARAVDEWFAHHVCKAMVGTADETAAILFKSARDKGQKSPYWVGENLVDLIWKFPCYVFIVFDLDNAKFIDKPNVPEFDPIQFHQSKPIYDTDPVQYRNYDANHSFYDGKVVSIEGRSAFRCVNYFRDEYGNELKSPQVRSYGYEIRYLAKWGTGNPVPHDIDPDGQNQGPPALWSLVSRVMDQGSEDDEEAAS